MKILLTGVAGFIGFHTAIKLLEEGHEVIGVDDINFYYDVNLKYLRLNELGINRKNIVFEKILNSDKYEKFSFIRLDLSSIEKIEKHFSEHTFDKIIHLAAQAGVRFSIENPQNYIINNIYSFCNILEFFKDKTEHLIYASSSSVYGDNIITPFSIHHKTDRPSNMYAVTKKTNELMAYTYEKMYNLKCTGLRFFTVYGPYGRPDMAYYLFADKINKGEQIDVFGSGLMKRDFTYIDDIVDGINKIVNYNKDYLEDVYNLGNESPISVTKLIRIIEKELGKEANINLLPMQKGEVKETYADISRSRLIGYDPKTNIEEGVKKFINWYLIKYYIDNSRE